ncbi:MAG: c-type cytochrome [candidate division Zixibacteria bacterium]|nr:c-type cytochrome [candidate division Zixibacteria bacterium]
MSRGWLYWWLKDPRDYLKASRMPTFRLKDDEIRDLVEYLMGLDAENSPPHPITALASAAGRSDTGAVIVSESRCVSCHTINDRGGKLAPELERIGDKVRPEWLPNFLRNVHYYQPEKRMLEYNFTDQNALDIASYLLGEFSEQAYALPDVAGQGPQSLSRKEERAQQGLKLFAKYGCGGCHAVGGRGRLPKVGPKLTNIGNRLESLLDFGTQRDVVPTLYNWLFMKIKKPDIFDSSSAMPNFYLTDKEAFEITVALLGNRDNHYASEFLVRKTERSLYKKPSGEFGELFDRYSCITCHSIDRYGGTLSTVPLTSEGSKVKFEWLRDYLINPSALRPILTERMPKFRMTEREASLMADYIKRVYVSDEIPRFFEFELKPADAETGRQLFQSYQCVNCHITDGAGGYVGPDLDNTGNRLEAGWVLKWLMNPLKYKPETIHPDFGFTEPEARQLTAYLMTKRQAHP